MVELSKDVHVLQTRSDVKICVEGQNEIFSAIHPPLRPVNTEDFSADSKGEQHSMFSKWNPSVASKFTELCPEVTTGNTV